MALRERFDHALNDLRDDILLMGSRVDVEMKLALHAYKKLDIASAQQVQAADRDVNQCRSDIEEDCFILICTQQPAARDLRQIFAAINMVVDLERMGDQAKGIAKVVPHLAVYPNHPRPPQLAQMGELVLGMLTQTLQAYAQDDIELASAVPGQDEEVDMLLGQVFSQTMEFIAQEANLPECAQAAYEVLRVGRELERFGDLASNVADRVAYILSGRLQQ